MYGTPFIISPRASRVNMPRRGKVFRIRFGITSGHGSKESKGEKTGPDLRIRPVPFSAAPVPCPPFSPAGYGRASGSISMELYEVTLRVTS